VPLTHCGPWRRTPETCRALGKPADDATLIAALGDVGLEAPERVLTLYPFEMSGGMLQRMMIAMALLSDAAFIVADEPTTDLDAVAQAKFSICSNVSYKPATAACCWLPMIWA
jgi:ABC-type dipeptide/oligopeptide/nickel transport system ATPase component